MRKNPTCHYVFRMLCVFWITSDCKLRPSIIEPWKKSWKINGRGPVRIRSVSSSKHVIDIFTQFRSFLDASSRFGEGRKMFHTSNRHRFRARDRNRSRSSTEPVISGNAVQHMVNLTHLSKNLYKIKRFKITSSSPYRPRYDGNRPASCQKEWTMIMAASSEADLRNFLKDFS